MRKGLILAGALLEEDGLVRVVLVEGVGVGGFWWRYLPT